MTGSTQAVLFVVGAAVAASGFIALVFGINRALAPRNPTDEKLMPYECGMEQAGPPWATVRIRYATIALLFVLFDAEAILLFAVASRLRGSVAALIEVGAFTAFLALGLAIAWRKGALTWRL